MSREGDLRKGAAQRLARARQRARKLRAEGKSYREIAELLGCSLATAHSYINAPARHAPPPPEPDNQRATSHGAHSRVSLGALAEKYRERAAERWPFLTPDDVEAWALLAARHELAVGAELEGGIFEPDGRIRDVTNKGVQWGARLAKVTLAHDQEAERLAETHGQGRGEQGPGEWSRLAALADGPRVSQLVAELRGRPWGDVITDPVLMGMAELALAEMEGRPLTPNPPERESGTVERARLDRRPAPLELPPAPGDRAREA